MEKALVILFFCLLALTPPRAQSTLSAELDATGAINATAGLGVAYSPEPRLLLRAYGHRRFRSTRQVVDYNPIAGTSRDDDGWSWEVNAAYRVLQPERPDARFVPYVGLATYRLWRNGTTAVCLLGLCDTSAFQRDRGQFVGGIVGATFHLRSRLYLDGFVGYATRVSATEAADLPRRRPHGRVSLGWVLFRRD